eukprot:UN29129
MTHLLFIEMRFSWQSTIDGRRGLFSQTEDPTPHRIWINFFVGSLPGVTLRSEEILHSITKMVAMAMANTEILNRSSKSFGTYLQMLDLTQQILNISDNLPEILTSLSETCLTYRYFQCFYHWFDTKPKFHNCKDWNQTKSDAHYLIKLCEYVKQGKVEQGSTMSIVQKDSDLTILGLSDKTMRRNTSHSGV